MSHRMGLRMVGNCLLLATLWASAGCEAERAQQSQPIAGTSADSAAEAGVVTIVVERPGEPSRQQEVAVTERQTVVEVMQASTLDWQMSGSGSTALVKSLEGLPMEAGRGWIYRINGKWASRGIGQTEVSPGDEIRWQYGRFDELFEED